jgi:predicted RNA-binding protein
MSIAIFTPIAGVIAASVEGGEKVWGKLVQKVVDEAELAEHVAAGWFTDASEAVIAADTAQTEAENAALQVQIADAQAKLDGRTKAGKAAKAADPIADAAPSSSEPQADAQSAS